MKLFLILLTLLLFVAAGILAVGWYFSGQILTPQPYSLMPEFEVLAREGETVTLPVIAEPAQFADTAREGRYNLLWEDGYGSLGRVREQSEEGLVRGLELVQGQAPTTGSPARLDVFIYRQDPLADHGLAFETITLDGEAGALQGWWLEQTSDTAILMLHGRRRADRRETLRIMPTLVEMGYSVFALAYRNHDASDPSPDGFFHYGDSEWQDALTALDWLERQGIERIVLYGFSMGGAVSLETLKRLRERDNSPVEALIMEGPLLDPRTVFRNSAEQMGLPLAGPLTDLALWLGRLRAGIDWAELDQRRHADKLELPLLLIAGTADSTIPISLVDDFASRVSAPLSYKRMDGVEHIEGWNANAEAYEAWVREFLKTHAPP